MRWADELGAASRPPRRRRPARDRSRHVRTRHLARDVVAAVDHLPLRRARRGVGQRPDRPGRARPDRGAPLGPAHRPARRAVGVHPDRGRDTRRGTDRPDCRRARRRRRRRLGCRRTDRAAPAGAGPMSIARGRCWAARPTGSTRWPPGSNRRSPIRIAPGSPPRSPSWSPRSPASSAISSRTPGSVRARRASPRAIGRTTKRCDLAPTRSAALGATQPVADRRGWPTCRCPSMAHARPAGRRRRTRPSRADQWRAARADLEREAAALDRGRPGPRGRRGALRRTAPRPGRSARTARRLRDAGRPVPGWPRIRWSRRRTGRRATCSGRRPAI